MISIAAAQSAMTVTVCQRLHAGTVPDGTVVTVLNNDGTALPGNPSQTTTAGVATFASVPAPTGGNTTYEVVVSIPPGAKGVAKVCHSIAPGTNPKVYYTAVKALVDQSLAAPTPVGFATVRIYTINVTTAVTGLTPAVWLPDATYPETFSMSPGLPGSQSFTLGTWSSPNLVAASGYVALPSDLTRIDFTAKNPNNTSYIAHSGDWMLFPQESYTLAVNGTVISPSFWIPDGNYIGVLNNSPSAGASFFNVGTPSAIINKNVSVSANNGWLIGALTDLNSNPVANFSVTAQDALGNVVASTTSDGDGYYILETPPGVFTITIQDSPGNYIPATWGGVSLPVGQVETIDAAMTPWSGFTGHIVDQNNNPIPGYGINIYDSNNNLVVTAVTDGSGNYTQKLHTGSYRLNYGDGERNFNLGPYSIAIGQMRNVSFQVTLSGVASGNVSAGPFVGQTFSEPPLAGATVHIYNGSFSQFTTTDGNGNYSMIVPDGNYNFDATAPNFSSFGEFGGQVHTGQTTTFPPIALSRQNTTITVHTRDQNSLEASGRPVHLYPANGQGGNYLLYSNNSGNTTFTVPPGSYYAKVDQADLLQGTQTGSFFSNSNQTTSQDLQLGWQYGSINVSGFVSSSAFPNGINGANVTVKMFVLGIPLEWTSTQTDGGGVYRVNFDTSIYFLWEIQFDYNGHSGVSQLQDATGNATLRLDFQLSS